MRSKSSVTAGQAQHGGGTAAGLLLPDLVCHSLRRLVRHDHGGPERQLGRGPTGGQEQIVAGIQANRWAFSARTVQAPLGVQGVKDWP